MLTPGRIYVNTTTRIAVNFQDDDATDVDPTTVTFKAYSPSGTTTTYAYATDAELVRADTGDYYVDFEPDEPGRWFYRWASTGTGTAIALEGTFVVQASVFYDDPPRDAYRS
jgi:hypothetical protein